MFFLWRPFVAARNWLLPATRAGQDRQSSRSRRVGITGLLILTLGLTTVALVYARPLYNAWQDWRALRMVAEARSLHDQGDYYPAIMTAQEAYILSPENPEAIRLNAFFFTLMKKSEALYFWDKLSAQDELTPEDSLVRIRALLNADRGKEARQELELWITQNPPQEETIKLAQEVFGQSAFNGSFLPKLKDYAREHPEDRDSRLRLAILQIDSGLTSELREALEHLKELAKGADQTSLIAIETLSATPQLPPEELYPLIELLENHPRSTAYHHIQALRHRLHLNPARRISLIASAVERFRDATREDMLPVIRWLVEENEHQQVLSLLDEDTAIDYLPLLENYLTSLTALNRFEDLRRLINDPRVNRIITRSTAAFYQLHLAFVTRRPIAELRNRMETATLHAEREGRSELLLSIGKYGELRAMADLAEPAYRAAMRSRRTANEALEGLLRATLLCGNTASHLAALSDATRQWPDNQNYQEDLAYIRLLTGVHMETSQHVAETIVQKRPEDHAARLIAAMAAWRMLDLDRARSHLRNLDPAAISPGQRSVYAAIANTCGLPDEARLALATVPADASMFPQERQIFTGAYKLP